MNRRHARAISSTRTLSRFLALLAPLVLSIAGLPPFAPRARAEGDDGAPARVPNVLFLICDDLNCDLGAYGRSNVRSPNIDRLASRGLLFENAYCQYPLCCPSRASFLTGLYPDQTLIHRNAIYIREHTPNVLTLPQLFRKNGHFALRIGKLYHYGVPRHIGTGGHDDPWSWDATINPRGRDKDEESEIFTLSPGNFGGTLSWLAAEGTDEEQTDGIGATEAIRALEKFAKSGRPFFLAVGLYRPHTPYVSPKRYFELYPREGIHPPEIPEGYLETLPEPARSTIMRKRDQLGISDELKREAIQAYHASITFADAQIGRILDALEKTGLASNTFVVFTSDHGYHMGEHGHFQKVTLFENATRVPLIIAGPGIETRGKRTSALVEMVDIYPTLAELCELPRPAHLSGKSLVPVLRDPSARVRDSAFTQCESGYSLRTERYRYTEWGPEGKKGAELYDRRSDPSEMVNLADRPEHATIRAELSAKLHARIEDANRAPEGVEQLRFEDRRRVR